MRTLDEADLHTLELLAEDARRPFSDISAEVDLPVLAVSDCIGRLCEEGVIRRSIVDPNRSAFSGGMPALARLPIRPKFVDEVHDALHAVDPVQRLSVAADREVTTYVRLDGGSVRAQLDELADLLQVRDYETNLVESAEWSPTVNGTGFALECAERGNTATSEGESAYIGGSFYHFCCSFCLGRFEDQYDRLGVGANDD